MTTNTTTFDAAKALGATDEQAHCAHDILTETTADKLPALLKVIGDHGAGVVRAASEVFATRDPERIDEVISENYRGDFDSNGDFAQDLADGLGGVSEMLSGGTLSAEYYIDYERLGRDLVLSGDFDSYDGHYFWTA